MRYRIPIMILFVVILLSGCSDRNNQKGIRNETEVNFSSINLLPQTISYDQAVQTCNLTNLTHITLKNYNGRWEWSLTFVENGKVYYCRVDAKSGKVISVWRANLPNLSGIKPPSLIPFEKIRIDEHVAFETAIKNRGVAEWLAVHKNATLDRISLENSPRVILWRITWTDESNFAVLMAAVNATGGELISVRGASFGGMKE